jgi:hypothetical protein
MDTTAGEGSSRAAYLQNLEKEFDHPSDPEKEDRIEEVDSRSIPTSTTPSRRSHSTTSTTSNTASPEQKVIRFEDDDPENPNNCT